MVSNQAQSALGGHIHNANTWDDRSFHHIHPTWALGDQVVIHPTDGDYSVAVGGRLFFWEHRFLGNEGVAIFRIKVGKDIGSAALIADGYHARVDGWTSLAVFGGAVGVWLGYPLADPLVGLLITAILRAPNKTGWRHGRLEA